MPEIVSNPKVRKLEELNSSTWNFKSKKRENYDTGLISIITAVAVDLLCKEAPLAVLEKVFVFYIDHPYNDLSSNTTCCCHPPDPWLPHRGPWMDWIPAFRCCRKTATPGSLVSCPTR